MTDLLRVYNGETLMAEQPAPVELIELEPETEYNLTCAWFNGYKESEKVAVPTFTTLAEPEVPVLPTAMTVEKNAMQSKVGNTKTIRITFDPTNTTEKGITWVVDESALEYVPVPNDNELRFITKKTGTYTAVITSTANTNLTQTVTFTVTN